MPSFGARPEGTFAQCRGQFNPDRLISGKPRSSSNTEKPKDMGSYPLNSAQGMPYSYMPPSAGFLMNTGYGGFSTGGLPGGDPGSATSSENDAMPGTGAGKTVSFLERLSRRHYGAPTEAPPRTWPLVANLPSQNPGLPNIASQESVDDLTGKQFMDMPSTLDSGSDAMALQPQQEIPLNMNPASPDYVGRR